jgi:hypothetical protein
MAADLMLGDGGPSKLEREMLAVVVTPGCASAPRSAAGQAHCPELARGRAAAAPEGDAGLPVRLTETPDKIEEAGREGLSRT